MVVSRNRRHSARLSTRGRAVPARRSSDQTNHERQSLDIFLRALSEVAHGAKSPCVTFTNLCKLPYSRNISGAWNIKRGSRLFEIISSRVTGGAVFISRHATI